MVSSLLIHRHRVCQDGAIHHNHLGAKRGRGGLLRISKRGDRYVRSLLVHGARAGRRRAAHRDDRMSRWGTRLQKTRGTNTATVARANKLARIGWAVARPETQYRAA